MDLKCEVLRNSNVTGRVVEIGIGPAANLRCLNDSTSILSYIGIEPNENFEPFILQQAALANVSFPFEVVRGYAESVKCFVSKVS